jgi:hypothetical protein
MAGGLVRSAAGEPIRHAVVSVLRPEGELVDWSRADNDGRWSVVLPELGRYLVVCSAEGWQPRSALQELDAEGPAAEPRVIELEERLCVLGRVRRDGRPASGALVALTSHTGDVAVSTTTGADGSYRLAMPPTGRYVLTVLDPATGVARARPLVVTPQLQPQDVELAETGSAG